VLCKGTLCSLMGTLSIVIETQCVDMGMWAACYSAGLPDLQVI
jgi:hypothetical protein